jgi:hypothetical protein
LKLTLIRDIFTEQSTTGKLLVDGKFFCYTLEDFVRPQGAKKVYGKTAIPAGIYLIDITWSNRFKRWLPLLLNVPGFAGIRIHPGNTAADTEGCILVGASRSMDRVTESRNAFELLYKLLHEAKAKNQPLTIEILEEEQ